MFHESVTDKRYPFINPLIYGFEACEKSHFYGPAVRTHWLIHYVVSGSGIFRIGESTYSLSMGEMFVIPPYVETYYEADANTPWEYIWIGFDCDKLPVDLEDTIRCPAALTVFEDIRACKDKQNGKPEYLCAKIWELFSILEERTTASEDYIETALNYIHTEYVNGITVKELSEKLNLNRTYFSVLFKKRTGLSPADYLFRYRMTKAASLLTEKKKSISVTALSVGYPDIYTFSKAFKRYFGMSPRKYTEASQ